MRVLLSAHISTYKSVIDVQTTLNTILTDVRILKCDQLNQIPDIFIFALSKDRRCISCIPSPQKYLILLNQYTETFKLSML